VADDLFENGAAAKQFRRGLMPALELFKKPKRDRHPEVRALARLEGWATNSSFEARRRRLAPQDDAFS
jgi:hypothetical protein